MLVYATQVRDLQTNQMIMRFTKTLQDARNIARNFLGGEGLVRQQIPIFQVQIAKVTTAIVLAMLNNGNYALSQRVKEYWTSSPCGKCEFCEGEDNHNMCKSRDIEKISKGSGVPA